jgi:hypothetical protein
MVTVQITGRWHAQIKMQHLWAFATGPRRLLQLRHLLKR